MTQQASKIISELKSLGSPQRAKHSLRFFKTGPGQYGEGDLFYGATVPEMRTVARKYRDINLDEIIELLHDRYHECRLVALLILVDKFELAEKRKDETEKKKIYDIYLGNTKYINNWDLVDVTAHKIVGAYLFDKNRSILYGLAKSDDLWKKRISIISTAYFINKREFDDTIRISEILVDDKHDLIQKAVGWMLREVGKRDQDVEEKFLKRHYKTMPRTMLRYAIEKFDDKKKRFYMER